MDLYKTIQILHAERERLTKLIAHLEHLTTSKAEPFRKAERHRGRKRMSEAEKREVSQRMKKYWEARRGSSGAGSEAAAEEPPNPPTAATA